MELERIGVATGHKNKLAAKGIESVEDLLAYMPRKYNDFTKITGILPPDRQSCILIRIKNVSYHAARNNSSKNADMVLCTGFELDTGKAVSLQWFNSNWMYDRVRATRYDKVFIAGKFTFDAKFNNYSCVNPDVFTDDVGDGMKVYPVYSKIQGISNNWLIDHLELAAQSDAAKEETVPEDILTAVNLSGMAATYRYLHHPASMDEVEKGKERILFNDLLDFALRNEYALRQNSFGSQYNIKTLELYNAVRHNLAFALTPDQDAAIQTIISTAREGKRVNIAEKYGITKQCIYAMYKKLPKRERKVQTREVRDAGISRSIVIDVCYEYLLGTTEQALMEKYGLSKEQLYSCFYAVTDRVAGYRTVRGHKYELFDGLEKWRYANNMSLKGLAEVAGISPYFLMGMLRGWMHMPYNVASSLAGLSSMTLPELFHEMYTIDDNIRDNMYMKDAVKNIEAAIENGNSPQKEDIAYVCLAYADLQSDRKDAS